MTNYQTPTNGLMQPEEVDHKSLHHYQKSPLLAPKVPGRATVGAAETVQLEHRLGNWRPQPDVATQPSDQHTNTSRAQASRFLPARCQPVEV